MAHQTSSQRGDEEIGPIYRFDPQTGSFALVERSVWDTAEGRATSCSGSVYRETAFQVTGFATQTLEYEGRTVRVRGGRALRVQPAPHSLASAVISATGGRSIPFLSAAGGSGQHYHQLFSEVDGSPIGDAVRIGVGAALGGTPVRGCWTDDERYILYVDFANSRFQRICIVPITDPLPQPPEQQTEEEPQPEDASP